MAEDGFHEIQLSGKQLVFLFMAATVVVVVIFLLGVMVGRGVKAEKAASTVVAESEPLPQSVPSATPPPPAVPAPTGTGKPQPTSEDLSYPKRLEGDKAPAETLKPQASPAHVDETPPAVPDEPPEKSAAPAANASSQSGEPAGQGYAVQVAAVREGAEADRMVKHLVDKGYAAYVVAPAAGSTPVYRVRVGKFKSRAQAETVKRKLEKEEQYKPWIIR